MSARRLAAAATAVFLALPSRAEAPRPLDPLQRSAAAYREGRLMDALNEAVDALEANPASLPAKNYLLTISEAIKKEKNALTLRPGEKEKSVRAAKAYIALKRQRSEEVLRELRGASAKSRDLRSPAGLFSTLQDLDRSLGPGFQSGALDGQAHIYFSNILDNLEKALGKRSFVDAKDRFRAEGYLAYYKNDLPGAVDHWEKALRVDPDDAQVKNDLESVRRTMQMEKDRKRLEEYVARAEASFDAGLYADAVEAWREVYKMDPKRPGLVESMAAARVAHEKAKSRKMIDALMAQASEDYKRGAFTDAASAWLDVLQLDPTYQSARTWLKLVGKKLKEEPRETAQAPKPAAPEPKTRAPAAEPIPTPVSGEAEELYRKGLIAYSQGDIEGAMGWLQKSLQRDPKLRRAQQALEQCQTETQLIRK